MQSRRQILPILSLLFAVCVSAVFCFAENGAIDPINIAIAELAQGGRATDDAVVTLRNLPSAEVVPALVQALQKQAFLEDLPRSAAYELLEFHRAAQWDAGLDQLISCLSERVEQRVCVKGLVVSPTGAASPKTSASRVGLTTPRAVDRTSDRLPSALPRPF